MSGVSIEICNATIDLPPITFTTFPLPILYAQSGFDITTTLTTPRKQTRKIFPIHLTSFEHYMLVDDRPKFPMTFIVQLDLRGTIDQTAFGEAIKDALARHPLLTAVIGPGKGGKDCWISAPNPNPVVDWRSLDQSIEFPDGEYIDIRKEVGLRIFVRHDDEQAVVTAQFHHCACDGIGSYQFLGDLLHGYAIRTGADLAPQVELDAKRLRDRGKVSYDLNNFRLPDGGYQRTWDEALFHLLRTNIVLRPKQKKGRVFNRPFPGIQSFTFDKEDHKKLRLEAQSQGQNINDMLLEKLFVTLHRWNQNHRKLPIKQHVSVMMPLNLREQSDNDISACNIVAHAFIRRSKKALRNEELFRQQLGAEVLQVKHERHKVRFMHMIAGGHYLFPKTLKASLRIKSSLATAILSNTGDPTRQFLTAFPREKGVVRCGNLLLEDLAGVPPLRPGTNATISIFTYRRELKICMRCDPHQFSEQDTQELLELFVANL